MPEVRKALAERGHEIQVVGSFSTDMGGGQAVRRDFSSGVNFGGFGSAQRWSGNSSGEPRKVKCLANAVRLLRSVTASL